MSLPYPPSLSVAFGRSATPPYIHEVPIESQITITPGAASWETGFVPLNMTLKTAGGVAPFGNDVNGVLNYISANVVWLCAGGSFVFNQNIVDNNGGYPVGAVLRSASDPSQYFYNSVADNANDPDSVSTGWIKFSPLASPTGHQVEAPAAGTYNNFSLDEGVGFLDVDTTAGDVVITGFDVANVADGRILTVTNTGPNLLTLAALNGGSSSGNQLRAPSDLSFTQNDGMSIRRSATIGKWVRM